MPNYRVSMDIGGTFTDIVAYDQAAGTYEATKASTTPGNLSAGVIAGLESIVTDLSDIEFLVHGTTQGLNAFLERRGVPVLLLATAGVEDSYHIARGPRLELYNAQYRKPAPLVERKDVIGVGGRLDGQGHEIRPLDEVAVRQAARRALDEGYGAVAVAFLFSYKNAAHELRAREILLEELGEDFTISLSHEAAKEWREYERTSSAVVEAYTGPVVRNYLLDLEEKLADRGVEAPLHIMQSSGGVLTAESARKRPLQTLLSGPVGGAMGDVELAGVSGNRNLIGVDMGGTSFDVSLVVDGKPDVSTEAHLEGLPMLMSVVNIHTVGAGGGSVAWLEAGGLRVGHRSAALDREAAITALKTVGDQLGLDPIAMAEGICDVANSQMAQAIRTITISRGIEPRDFALVAFGGAGPMHAVFLAKELGIPETVVPRFPGAFSAWGMLQTNIRKDFSEPYFFLDEDINVADMAGVLRRMEVEGLKSLVSEGVPEESRLTSASVDVRYQSQEFSLNVPLTSADEPESEGFVANLAARFSAMYHERYGHSNLGAPIEIVALRTQAVGDLGRLEAPLFATAQSPEFKHEMRRVVFDHEEHETTVVRRDDLAAGHAFEGPAIIVEQTATTVVPPGFNVTVDEFGSLVIRTEDAEGN
jgi:N-methylhydantoinase A